MAKKRWAAILVGIVVALAVIWLVKGRDTNRRNNDQATQVIQVTRGNIEEVVTAQGKLEPKEYVDVGTQVSGQLKTLHVDIGSNVKKGDLLAEIDARLYESRFEADTAQLKSLEAQLAEQQANLLLARQQHARNVLLIKTNAISKDAFDISAATLKSAEARLLTQKAEIEVMQSTLKGDRTNLEYTKIYAPMDGTVVALPTREGQTLNANQTAPTIMQLANLDVMTIRAQVAEADVMRLKQGMSVHFTTLGPPARQWKASIRQILPSPEVINDVVLYNVLVDVDNRERLLMNGMSTQLFFELGSARDVLVIPIDVLGKRTPQEDNASGLGYRIRKADGTDTLVHVGLMDRNNAEIRDGLAEGDEVMIAPKATPTRQGQGNRANMMGGGPRL